MHYRMSRRASVKPGESVVISVTTQQPDLCFQLQVMDHLCERRRKIKTTMRLCHLNNIKDHRHWSSLMLKMDSERDHRLLVRRGPRVSCEVELPVVVLSVSELCRLSPTTNLSDL